MDNLAEQLAPYSTEMVMRWIHGNNKIEEDENQEGGHFKKWPFRRFTTDEVLRKIGEVTHSELGTKVTVVKVKD